MESSVVFSAPAPLTAAHEIAAFDCGVPALNEWLRRRALANQASGASRTFVLCEGERVAAYYALASSAVTVTQTTGRFRRNMPDPIPVVVLARLAIASAHQGRGLGRALVADAATRVLRAAEVIGVRGILVHAMWENTARFYRQVGFDPSPLDPLTLMITLTDVHATLEP